MAGTVRGFGSDWSIPGGAKSSLSEIFASLDPQGRQPVRKGELFTNVRDHGAVGNGVADDTAALAAAVTASTSNGSKRIYVPAGTYLTSGWDIPNDVAVYGAAQRTANIKAMTLGQAYVIRYGSNTELHDLNVLGAKLANSCVLSHPNLHGKARFQRVRVQDGVSGGFVFDRHQNAKLYDCYAHYCGIGYAFINGAANIQLFGCDSDGEPGVSKHGAFAGNVFDNPAWTTSAIFEGGGRNIRWFAGILERGAADAQIKVIQGNLTLFGVEINGGDQATVIADGSLGVEAKVSLNDCSSTMTATNVAGIAKNGGRILVQGWGGRNTGGPATRGHQYIAQGGFIGGDGVRPMDNVTHPLGSRFENGNTGMAPSGGGTVTFDSTKNEYVISSASTDAGGYTYWGASPGPDNKRLLVVEVYLSAITGGNARVYTTLAASPWRRLHRQALGPGLHKFVIPLQGDETGVQIAPDQATATEIRVPFMDLSVR